MGKKRRAVINYNEATRLLLAMAVNPNEMFGLLINISNSVQNKFVLESEDISAIIAKLGTVRSLTDESIRRITGEAINNIVSELNLTQLNTNNVTYTTYVGYGIIEEMA